MAKVLIAGDEDTKIPLLAAEAPGQNIQERTIRAPDGTIQALRMVDCDGYAFAYTGEGDASGLAHGRGKLVYDNSLLGWGTFAAGAMTEGVVYADAGNPILTMRQGSWTEGIDRALTDDYSFQIQQIEIGFKAGGEQGGFGLQFTKTGVVSKARDLEVKVGWVLRQIDGEPFTAELLHAKETAVGVECTLLFDKGQIAYLPVVVDGVQVLTPEKGGGKYTVDNTKFKKLKDPGLGLNYRHSTQLDDEMDELVPWDFVIAGCDVGSGWIRTVIATKSLYNTWDMVSARLCHRMQKLVWLEIGAMAIMFPMALSGGFNLLMICYTIILVTFVCAVVETFFMASEAGKMSYYEHDLGEMSYKSAFESTTFASLVPKNRFFSARNLHSHASTRGLTLAGRVAKNPTSMAGLFFSVLMKVPNYMESMSMLVAWPGANKAWEADPANREKWMMVTAGTPMFFVGYFHLPWLLLGSIAGFALVHAVLFQFYQRDSAFRCSPGHLDLKKCWSSMTQAAVFGNLTLMAAIGYAVQGSIADLGKLLGTLPETCKDTLGLAPLWGRVLVPSGIRVYISIFMLGATIDKLSYMSAVQQIAAICIALATMAQTVSSQWRNIQFRNEQIKELSQEQEQSVLDQNQAFIEKHKKQRPWDIATLVVTVFLLADMTAHAIGIQACQSHLFSPMQVLTTGELCIQI